MSPPDAPPGQTPIFAAHDHGQSIWLDNISRELLLSGELRRWVEHEGIRGVTSNPSIFEKAIAKTSDYDPATRALIRQSAGDALDVFERLAVQDIQLGCDVLRPIWESSQGQDGFVSLEVSPHLAGDTAGTVAEAHRLARAVSRENLMIKVPATQEGIPAIQRLIADGVSVNVTLLFAVDAYEAVHEAYLSGLETRLERGETLDGIASVASFFISRIDASVSTAIADRLESEQNPERRERLTALNAKVAIANAQIAYARFLETLASDRWKRLAKAGAAPQRVLWASTGTKDPALPKTLYVDELIGRHTVNTLPDATLEAFRSEGRVRDALGTDPAALEARAQPVLTELAALGIDLTRITDELLTRGCELFTDAFDGLLHSVEMKRQLLLGPALSRMSCQLGEAETDVAAAAETWRANGSSHALWRRDASLFSGADENRWMGWLDLPTAPADVAFGRQSLREAVLDHPAEIAVVIGMGGSSLWPDVLARAFPDRTESSADGKRSRRLYVLDSTVPEAFQPQIDQLDLNRCLFFMSSKSGSTIEPNALFERIYADLCAQSGAEAAGRHFVAITDPGSDLEARARELGFLGIALGRPDVGGRFSALSPFGMLPAESIGLDPEEMQARARLMAAACRPFVPPEHNPGVGLGLALGTLVQQGRDKLTLTASPDVAAFTDWIEQLVAESTGKRGMGLVPIAGESLAEPTDYAPDRIFVDLAIDGDESRSASLDALAAAGHPVIRIAMAERLDLVQEVYRWEVATAVIGSLLELNPFDQPDVESAKVASRELLAGASAGLAVPKPTLEVDDQRWIVAPALGTLSGADAPRILSTLIRSIQSDDTFAINAFLADTREIRERLESLRLRVRDLAHVATTLDFGPRYLHSTGQLQKGGPNRWVGLHLWQSAGARGPNRTEIPRIGGDFETLAEAQAVGDFCVLAERNRRLIGIDLGPDVHAALARLDAWFAAAMEAE